MHKDHDPAESCGPGDRSDNVPAKQAPGRHFRSVSFQRYSSVLLLLIVLLGFGIRLTALKWGQAYSYFGQGDAVEAYQVAVNYGHGEPRALYLGQPNYNFHSKLPGPLWTIFCFVSLRAWGSTEGVVLAIILLNTVAIYLIYALAKQTLGNRVALLAALFTAIFPWVVYYSGGLYNPDIMSFPGALLFFVLWRSIQFERSPVVFWAPILLLALPQFHMSGLLLIPATALVLWLSPRRLNLPWLGIGFLAALCLYLPYFRGEAADHWKNTRAMFASDGAANGYTFESLKAISAPLSFLVNWGPRWTRTAAEYRELGRAVFGSFAILLVCNIISMVVAGFLILGAFFEIKQSMAGFWRAPRDVFARAPGLSLLVLLVFAPLLLATIGGKPFHTRYCVVLLPALLPLAAVGAARWLDRRDVVGRVFLAGLILTCCVNVWLMPAMFRHQGRQIEQGSIFIPSFQQLETLYQSLKNHAGTNCVLEIDDSAYLHSLRPEEKQLRDAALIRRYVTIREKDGMHPPGEPTRCVYELRRADAVPPGLRTIAYSSHGIAVVARSEGAAH
jgi:4-amino-4-deoxy-L-arabinose transferase-like glycosyltransferase